jgi:hypothetical protein
LADVLIIGHHQTMDKVMRESGVSRRGFLQGSLGAALTVTALGTTGLTLNASSARAAGTFVADVMGNYAFTDVKTGCRVTVSVANGVRRISANGLPNHATGAFPNAHNPNSISQQRYDYSIPTSPKKTSTGVPFGIPQPFGIGVNGVIFDPIAAEYYKGDRNSGWNYNALGGGIDLGLDSNNAHLQPTGAYHYHGLPTGLDDSVMRSGHSPLVGWAGDGFPIYLNRAYKNPKKAGSGFVSLRSSYKLKSGTRPSGPGGTYNGDFVEDYQYVAGSGELDAANGRFQVTPEYPKGTYCYILTSTFPNIPRAFVGSIASSFVKSPGQGAPPR